jgi:NADH dehydrogenase (ubiquinone) Fe-S protein 1
MFGDHFSCSLQDINEEWISDKTQFCYDGLKRQRLNDPMIRGPDGRFKAVTWRDALAVVAEVLQQVKPEEITGVAGKLSDAESMMALKDFLTEWVQIRYFVREMVPILRQICDLTT